MPVPKGKENQADLRAVKQQRLPTPASGPKSAAARSLDRDKRLSGLNKPFMNN